jgi:selenocysteine-specific elongation factor
VRTMVAGAAGMDAVLLCVSAVDGVMPQTIEHVGICESLGIREGIVVLTMADQVDDELLELAEADVEDLINGTFLDGAPVIGVSSLTGIGMPALRTAIASLSPTQRTTDGPFRLPVDRVFSRSGFGSIASGTVWSGEVGLDRPLWLLPDAVHVRVRGMHVHGDSVDHAVAGQRLAINVAGASKEMLRRGVTLASEPLPTTHIVDAKLSALPRGEALSDGESVRVLLGTSEAMGRVNFASERDPLVPGTSVYAQLRLDTPLTCVPGDRFIVRRPSPESTLAGGVVLDPWAKRMRTKYKKQAHTELMRLEQGDRTVLLERADEAGLTETEVQQRGVSDLGIMLADHRFAASVVGRLEGRLLDMMAEYHNANPLSLGAKRRELHRDGVGHLPPRVFDALVERLADTGLASIGGPLIRLTQFEVRLDTEQEELSHKTVAMVEAAGLDGIKLAVLTELLPHPEVLALLHLHAVAGRVHRIGDLGWFGQTTLNKLVLTVREWFSDNDTLDAQAFKQLSGQSRRTAIPLLEWLDASGITARQGDSRKLR